MPAWREPASPGTTDSLVSPEPSSAVLFASGQPGSDARTGNQTSECCMRGAWSALMQATKQPRSAPSYPARFAASNTNQNIKNQCISSVSFSLHHYNLFLKGIAPNFESYCTFCQEYEFSLLQFLSS